jgi:hypothetical protein
MHEQHVTSTTMLLIGNALKHGDAELLIKLVSPAHENIPFISVPIPRVLIADTSHEIL